MGEHTGPDYHRCDCYHQQDADKTPSTFSGNFAETDLGGSKFETKIYPVSNFKKAAERGEKKCKIHDVYSIGLKDDRAAGNVAQRLTLSEFSCIRRRLRAGGWEQTPIHKLPNELLDWIFSFLDLSQRIAIELVCKRWRYVGKDVTWSEPKQLVFDPWNRRVNPTKQKWALNNDNFVAILSRCGPSVRHITLVKLDSPKRNPSYKVLVTEDSLKTIARYCPNLEEIKLKYFRLHRKDLLYLAKGCRKLKRVNFSKFGTSDDGFTAFYEGCKTLDSLTLDPDHKKVLRCDLHNDGVYGEGFNVINPNLQVLNLRSCDNLQQFAFTSMVRTFHGIQELHLNVTYPEKVNSELILEVLCHFRDTLKLLNLALPLKPFNWCAALKALHKLQELYLHTQGIVLDCPCYRSKTCFNQVSTNLRILRVSETSPLNSNNEEYILTNFFTSCDGFEELYLTRSNLSPQTLSLILKYSDTLKILDLSRFKSRYCQWRNYFIVFRNLESLKLTNCNEVNDDVANVLSQECLNLRVLHLCSSDITDEGLTYLASLPYLTVLDASDCRRISDDGVQVLAAHGRLEELYVATSSNVITDVSDAGCASLALFCPRFRLLDVSNVLGTGKITDNLVTSFREAVRDGFLKQNVELLVGGTAVHEGVETCDGLSVFFNYYYSFNALVAETMDAFQVFTEFPNG